MTRRFLLSVLMFISTSAFGEYLKGVNPPEVAERDAYGFCYFVASVVLDLKIPAGTQIVVLLEDSNGINFPMSWSWTSDDRFKGVWGFELPGPLYNGQEWYLYAYIAPPDQKAEVITPADRVVAFSCPYIP